MNRAARTQTLAATTVVAQAETVYDLRDSAVEQHTYELNAGESTGITPTSTNYTRRSVFAWHDNAGRLTTQADYGSGGPTWSYYPKPARPATAPAESTNIALVTKIGYNADNGEREITTDASGRNHKTIYDALGRTAITYRNYKSGTSTAADEDVETRYTYSGNNKTTTLTAVNPATGNQITRYLYEDPFDASLETNVIFPDSFDTNSNGSDQIKTACYLDANVRTMTDQNGTTRIFSYDSQRRQIADIVTAFGTGVDDRVHKITSTYGWHGAMTSIASYDINNVILNEVKGEYDSNFKLARLYQSHSGPVNANTTPYLAYSYGTIEKRYRRLGATYPSGKALLYDYGTTGSVTDQFDGVSAIVEDDSPLVSYVYNGSWNTMQTICNEPGLSLTYASGGLDRFGRVVNHGWMKNNNPIVHIIHEYDFVGNRTSRYDAIHAENSELYEYDEINQIKNLDRGILNQSRNQITTANFAESWSFDKTGNWLQYDKNGTAENRTHNTANEIQNSNMYDANGNMTLMPGLKGKYDAWNRLVEVRDNSDNLIAEYSYNGLDHRISKKVGNVVTNSFFNEKWQELESTADNITTSYVWGERYIDDLIYREKGDERLYSLADPSWNVVALTDISGSVVERMKYDAFGKVTWLENDFSIKMESDFAWNRTFTGQVFDAETGLMLYCMRYYHSDLGRFVNRDPIEYWAADVNLYRYCFNMPVDSLDPLGLLAGPVIIKICNEVFNFLSDVKDLRDKTLQTKEAARIMEEIRKDLEKTEKEIEESEATKRPSSPRRPLSQPQTPRFQRPRTPRRTRPVSSSVPPVVGVPEQPSSPPVLADHTPSHEPATFPAPQPPESGDWKPGDGVPDGFHRPPRRPFPREE